MSPSRRRQANPNLGAYYGIVASAFVSLVVGLAMFEQLGWQETWLAQAMILVPLVLYLGIAFGARTLNVEDFFASGRRVPPVYNGAALSAMLIGNGLLRLYRHAVLSRLRRSPSGLPGQQGCSSRDSYSCLTCEVAPTRCRAFSVIASARVPSAP
jgi:hypothetical protein